MTKLHLLSEVSSEQANQVHTLDQSSLVGQWSGLPGGAVIYCEGGQAAAQA